MFWSRRASFGLGGVVVAVSLFAACGSDDAVGTETSLAGIVPGTAFLARTIEVNINGASTHFAGQPTIAFNDPAIKSTKVDVLSATSLRATIEVGEAASIGAHDVIVTTAGQGDTPEEVATLRGGLNIAPSLKYELGGTVTQGGLLDVVVVNLDKDTPFSGPISFDSGAIAARINEVTSARVAATALVDPLAPIGRLRLRLSARGPRGDRLGFVASPDDPMAPTVTAAKPVLALVPGQPAGAESLAAARQTNLYKATIPGPDHVFFFNMKTVGKSLRTTSGARLVGAMAPASGKFGEGSTFETTFDGLNGGRAAIGFASAPGDAYFAIHSSDLSGGPAGYEYSLQFEVQQAFPFSTKEPNPPDSPATPLATLDIEAPFFSNDGAIDAKDDADYVLFTPKNGGRIFVHALPIDSNVPLNVAIFGNDPGVINCSAFLAGGLGTKQAEAVTAAGITYCARVNSTSSMTTRYRLVISPEI